MVNISIPGRNIELKLTRLLLDMNGTISTDGVLLAGVKEKLERLKNDLDIYLLTADTVGNAVNVAEELGIELFKVSGDEGGQDKLDILNTLDTEKTIAIGNGYNDSLMLEHAVLSIVVLGEEGCSVHALKNADIMVKDINDALGLLLNPLRIIDTLRA